MNELSKLRKQNSNNFINTNKPYADAFVDNMLIGFEYNPSYLQAKKQINNIIQDDIYDVWITDEHSYKQDIGQKKIVMKPNQPLNKGDLFIIPKWNNQKWIVTKIDPQATYYNSGFMQKCNNILKWYDENNNLQQSLCVIQDETTRDKATWGKLPLPELDIKVITQNNINTSKIKINQRFIFDGQAFKIQRDSNFFREDPLDGDSVPLLEFNMFKDNEAPDDDLVNNIANVKQYQYSLIINQGNFNQSIGYMVQLTATVKLNNEIVTKDLNWEVSNNTIARIDNNGNLSLINNGTVNITCSLVDNPLVSNTITINVASRPVITSEIIISPNISQIDEDDTINFSIYKYTNGIKLSDTFNITTSGVPAKCYNVEIIDGNNFNITNNQRYFDNPLIVTCTDTTDNKVKNINIKLNGVF